mmetsp:Transcript_56288/g.163227  ORF Transcript_56288/g.163227 Transcript_56288/m.163227 type:complete len:506 (+) Transcript_56288:103-1620(+)
MAPSLQRRRRPVPALIASVASLSGALSAGASPCQERYRDWVAEPSVFIRSDQPKNLQGLHVVCVWRAAQGEPLQVEAYMNAVRSEAPLRAELPPDAEMGWREFRRDLKTALGFRRKSNDWGFLHLKQPFGIFAEYGRRLSSPKEAEDAGLIFVIEGGQWFWPPLRIGYERRLPGTEFSLETLSVQPVIFRVKGFLQENECDEIVKLGKGRMVSSPVSLMDKDKGKEAKEFRTSTQARIARAESPMLRVIDDRISALTKIPVPHNEEVQILRYEKTQYYSGHLDNWDPSFYTLDGADFIEHGHNNRLITVFWYLTNVSEGGETYFARADGLPQPMDMYGCNHGGLKVKPVQGNVIFWYSLHPNGNTDPNGLHAACPVSTGEKWSANYWVWNKPRAGGKMPDAGIDLPDDDERAENELVEGEQAVVVFTNGHPKRSVFLFWQSTSGDGDKFMGEVQPGSRVSMNTSPGHVWFFKAGPDPTSKKLKKMVITKERKQEFVIRPQRRDEM